MEDAWHVVGSLTAPTNGSNLYITKVQDQHSLKSGEMLMLSFLELQYVST